MILKILKSLLKFFLFVIAFTSLLYSIISYNTTYANKKTDKCENESIKILRSMPKKEAAMKPENRVTKDNLKWEVVKEKRIGEVGAYEVTMLKRKDGLTFADIGLNGEWQETFLVKGSFGEFKFLASRVKFRRPEENFADETYIELGKYGKYSILDKYIILTNWFGNVNKKLLLAYAKDIESALLHYPLQSFYKNIPVKEVVFDIGETTQPHYIHADDID